MKIPGIVKIGYKAYNVNIVDKEVVDGNKVCYGNIEYDNGNINISSLYSEDQQKCTFIHECLHGIDEIMETNLDEEQVRKLAKGIYQLIKDNPNMFILEGVKVDIKPTASVNPEEVVKKILDSLKEKTETNMSM